MFIYTVNNMSFQDGSERQVQAQIRLLPKEQSDQGLYCLLFLQRILDALLYCKYRLFYFFCNDGTVAGWLNGDFTPFSMVFQSYQDNRRMILKVC